MCDAMSLVSLSCQCVSEQCVIVFSDRHRHHHRGLTRGLPHGKPSARLSTWRLDYVMSNILVPQGKVVMYSWNTEPCGRLHFKCAV